MKTLILALFLLLGPLSFADAYMGEINKGTCTQLKGQTYGKYSKAVLSDRKYEVTLDEGGACGKSIYVMKREGRKRWAVFPDKKGCECYLNLSNSIEKNK